MISLPDFKEKQILFVNTEWGKPSHLRFYNDNIVFEKERKIVDRVSVHKAFAVFICGDLSLTTNFLKQAKEHGVSIFFLKNNFEMYGGLATTAEGHYLLRMKQYGLSEKEQLEMAKMIVLNKLTNQNSLMQERSDKEVCFKNQAVFEEYVKKVKNVKNQEELLGLEGNFSRQYFSCIFNDFKWRRRAPRTKEDIINFLMDMGYTFLFNFVDSLLRLHGFDTYKGFYHKLFFQRRSLACDVMEPFRFLIDKKIIKYLNLKQIDEKDFNIVNGSYQLPFDKNSKYASLFLSCLMEQKEPIFDFVHSFYRHTMDDKNNPFPVYNFK